MRHIGCRNVFQGDNVLRIDRRRVSRHSLEAAPVVMAEAQPDKPVGLVEAARPFLVGQAEQVPSLMVRAAAAEVVQTKVRYFGQEEPDWERAAVQPVSCHEYP